MTGLLSAIVDRFLRFMNGGGPDTCDECGTESYALRGDRYTEQELCRDCMDEANERAEEMYPPWQYWKAARDDSQ